MKDHPSQGVTPVPPIRICWSRPGQAAVCHRKTRTLRPRWAWMTPETAREVRSALTGGITDCP